MSLFGPPNIEKMKARRDVKGLIKALRNHNWRIQTSAHDALKEIGAAAMPSLIKALHDHRHEVRMSAAEALVAIYRSGKLDVDSKQLILAHQATIQQDNHNDHSDKWSAVSHWDGAYDKSSRPTHADETSCSHDDTHTDRHLTLDL
jgi:hypothetical protein